MSVRRARLAEKGCQCRTQASIAHEVRREADGMSMKNAPGLPLFRQTGSVMRSLRGINRQRLRPERPRRRRYRTFP